LWWFAGYGFIYVLNGLVIPQQFVSPFLVQLQTFIQLLVLCWIGSTLLQEEKFARHTVLAFSIATLFLATGMLLGLPRFSQTWGGERLSAAGFDPNGIAPIMALGAQAFIGFGIEQTRRAVGMRVTFIALSLLPLTAMVYTGSRGGILACVTGLALYALPYRRAKRKMTAILVATIAIVGVGYIVANNQTTLSRFEKSYETGNTAKRDKIFAASLEMFAEKPLLGWGAVIWGYELGSRAGRRANELGTHNLFLYLLVEVGLLGAAPFFIGLGSCVRAAWTARACSLEFIPLVWLITMLVDSMSIDTLRAKVLWLTLMLSLAAEAATIKRFKKKNIMSSVILQHVNQN
jgi:O-antigen ligase